MLGSYRLFNIKKSSLCEVRLFQLLFPKFGLLDTSSGEVVFFEEEIETSDAFREQFTTHGMCWTFNADGSRQVNRTGMQFTRLLEFQLQV